MHISVIGSGGWGTAIAKLLCENGHDVMLWSWKKEESEAIRLHRENKEFLPGIILPDAIQYTWDAKTAVLNQDLIVLSLPSHAIRSTLKSMASFLPKNQAVVNLSKGLEDVSLKRLSEVISEEWPSARVAVLSGPSHAEEVGKGIPTTVVASSEDSELCSMIQDAFISPVFRVYTNPDIIGVELGGAMKNVIALCAGVIDGMGFGDNTKAAMMTRGMVEIRRLGLAMGGLESTFNGLTGFGDLIVTCTSCHSRNHRAGVLIGQGKSPNEAIEEVHMVVEGVRAAKAGYLLSQRLGVEMPIVTNAYQMLFENKSPKQAIYELMTRTKKTEVEDALL